MPTEEESYTAPDDELNPNADIVPDVELNPNADVTPVLSPLGYPPGTLIPNYGIAPGGPQPGTPGTPGAPSHQPTAAEGFDYFREKLAQDAAQAENERRNRIQLEQMRGNELYSAALLQSQTSREEMVARQAMNAADLANRREMAIRQIAFDTWKEERQMEIARRTPGFLVPSLTELV